MHCHALWKGISCAIRGVYLFSGSDPAEGKCWMRPKKLTLLSLKGNSKPCFDFKQQQNFCSLCVPLKQDHVVTEWQAWAEILPCRGTEERWQSCADPLLVLGFVLKFFPVLSVKYIYILSVSLWDERCQHILLQSREQAEAHTRAMAAWRSELSGFRADSF